MRVERSILVHCPPEEVFTFLTRVENAGQWQGGTVETRLTSTGPVGIGSTMMHVGKFLGRRIEGTSQVYDYEPNRSFAYRTVRGLPVDIRYRFEPVAEGTRLTAIYGGEPGNFFRLAGPLVERATAKTLEGDLGRLKKVLEAK